MVCANDLLNHKCSLCKYITSFLNKTQKINDYKIWFCFSVTQYKNCAAVVTPFQFRATIRRKPSIWVKRGARND